MLSARIPNPVRKEVYRRDHYRCALCDSPKYIQVHHAVPRSQAGNDSLHNLITLCATCHGLAHGVTLPDIPELTPADVEQGCVEYLADMYAPDWWPYK